MFDHTTRKYIFASLLTFTTLTAAPLAQAAEVAGAQTALQGATESPTLRLNSAATVGYSFTVGNADLLVTGLGAFDYEGNGFANGDAMVGLWDSSGTSLGALAVTGEAVLGNTSAYNDGEGSGFRYVLFETPIQLSANTTYRLGARHENGNNIYYNLTGVSTFDGITLGSMRWSSDETALALPNLSAPPFYGTMFAADMLITAVPEPGSGMLLVMAATLSMSFVRRRATARQ